MRFLFWFLLLAIAAVVAALAAKLNSGYALLVAPPYRIELSLNLLLILIVGGFLLLYFGLRMVARTVQLPAQVRQWRRQQKEQRARGKLDAAVVALLEGRYGKAQQEAQESLALPHSSGLAGLVAARAAIDMRQFDAAEGLTLPTRDTGNKSRGTSPDAFGGDRTGTGAAARGIANSRVAAARGGSAYGSIAARAAGDAGRSTLRRDPSTGRTIGQAWRVRRGAGGAGTHRGAA